MFRLDGQTDLVVPEVLEVPWLLFVFGIGLTVSRGGTLMTSNIQTKLSVGAQKVQKFDKVPLLLPEWIFVAINYRDRNCSHRSPTPTKTTFPPGVHRSTQPDSRSRVGSNFLKFNG